jgi:hypothetical protein
VSNGRRVKRRGVKHPPHRRQLVAEARRQAEREAAFRTAMADVTAAAEGMVSSLLEALNADPKDSRTDS